MIMLTAMSVRRKTLPQFRAVRIDGSAGPRVARAWWRVLAGVGLAVGLAQSASASGIERVVSLPLADLGQPAQGSRPLAAGSTVATVHFVGDHHLLVTFPVRKLMKRLDECLPEDDDRMIDAVLLDVPSGTVAARSSWRVHDAGQYLWELDNGRFMLRVRDRLVTVAPLANLSTEEPFQERKLLAFDHRIRVVLVSPEADLLTVETQERVKPREVKATSVRVAGPGGGGVPALLRRTQGVNGVEQTEQPDPPVEMNFYRFVKRDEAVQAMAAGRLLARVPMDVPMTGKGYLDISEESKGRWLFDYIAHGGKKTELSPYDTTCYPSARFVSRSEFVAFGCRGSADKLEIGGFNMLGEQMWQQSFYDNFVNPAFSVAPEAGRFALGRAVTSTAPSERMGRDVTGEELTAEDVQVLQTETGKQLFHVSLTPAQRAGQNFSLAPDGMELAIIRAGAVEVYRLPVLSGKDKAAVKRVREVAVEDGDGPFLLPTRKRAAVLAADTSSQSAPAPSRGTSADASMASGSAAPKPAEPEKPAAAPAAVEHTVNVGDVPDDGPRKRPTLYGEGDGTPQ
jgi:hypothetical protein